MHGGRVVGRYFAQVTLPDKTFRLIDAAEPDLPRIEEAVRSEGHMPCVVVPQEWPAAVQRLVEGSGA